MSAGKTRDGPYSGAARRSTAPPRGRQQALHRHETPIASSLDDVFQDSPDLFEFAVEVSPTAMLLINQSAAIELVNKECERMFGYSRQELVGASIDLLIPESLRGRRLTQRPGFVAFASRRKLGAGEDLRAVRRGGAEFPVEIGLTPMRRERGLAVLAAVVDVSERRKTEKAMKQRIAELQQANASLAQFAFVASHDIQEPLRKIVAYSDILRTAVAENDAADVELASRIMSKSALQARDFVRDTLALARTINAALECDDIAIDDVVATAVQNQSLQISDLGAEVTLHVEPLRVRADRAQLLQLVQNILENALKYRDPQRPSRIAIATESELGRLTRLSIVDNGIGFPQHRNEEIFEPFKRLNPRDAYPGSGLGLAICRAVASRHGWKLQARATPGDGARFEVLFP